MGKTGERTFDSMGQACTAERRSGRRRKRGGVMGYNNNRGASEGKKRKTSESNSCPAGGGVARMTALDETLLVLVREFLECLHLRLLDQERREDTREHPEGKDLKPMSITINVRPSHCT